jgi:hypothetical protein
MAFLQLTAAGWKDSFRVFVRHASGNPRAKIPTKKYPWKDSFILVEAEEQADHPLLTVAAEVVLNSAVVQKHSLQGALAAASSTTDKALMILRVGASTAWSTCKAAGAQAQLRPSFSTTDRHSCCCMSAPGCRTAPDQPASQQTLAGDFAERQGRGVGADGGVLRKDCAARPPSLASAPGACGKPDHHYR